MSFPEKPDALKNLTPLEERLIIIIKIKILGRLIDKKNYTDDDVKGMSWQKNRN